MKNLPVQKAVDILGGQTALANACGVKQQYVWKWLRMERIPAERAIQIERATGGAVTRQELRPDLFGDLPRPVAPASTESEAA